MVHRNRLTAYFQELESKMRRTKEVKTVEQPEKKPGVDYSTLLAENLNFEFKHHPTIKGANALAAAIIERFPEAAAIRAETFKKWCRGGTKQPKQYYLEWVAACLGYDRWESLKEPGHQKYRQLEIENKALRAELESNKNLSSPDVRLCSELLTNNETAEEMQAMIKVFAKRLPKR